MKTPSRANILPETAPEINAIIATLLDANATRFIPWAIVVRTVLRQAPHISPDDVYPSCQSLAGLEYQDNREAGIMIRWRLKRADATLTTPAERDLEQDALAMRGEAWKRLTGKLHNSFGGSLDDLAECIDLIAEARGAPVHVTHPGLIAREVKRRMEANIGDAIK